MMENPVALQVGFFWRAVCFGAVMGLFYSALGVFRHRRRRWLTAVADGFFWTVTAPVTFVFFMRLNGGDMRVYLLAGALLGGAAVSGTLFLATGWQKIKRKQRHL